MSNFSIDTPSEFINALVHGWWANGASGSRLEELARCGTVDNLLRQLQSLGIIEAGVSNDAVLHSLLVRQYRKLDRLAHLSDSTTQPFYAALKEALQNENIKMILNYRFFPERVGKASDMLIPFPNAPQSASQISAIVEAPTTDQFTMLLCRGNTALPQLRQIIKRLEEDHDIMRAENAIDNIGFAKTIAAVANLRGNARDAINELMRRMTDCANAITLLRNASFYHLEPKDMEAAWVEGGELIHHHLWQTLAAEHDRNAVLAALPAPLTSVMAAQNTDSVAVLENRLHRQILRQARRYFTDSTAPELAGIVYPIMLHFETINLSRVYEGIRFSLPVATIMEMVVA
jgi:vacuolar-type H+-ATPase subunit C/Vma6